MLNIEHNMNTIIQYVKENYVHIKHMFSYFQLPA